MRIGSPSAASSSWCSRSAYLSRGRAPRMRLPPERGQGGRVAGGCEAQQRRGRAGRSRAPAAQFGALFVERRGLGSGGAASARAEPSIEDARAAQNGPTIRGAGGRTPPPPGRRPPRAGGPAAASCAACSSSPPRPSTARGRRRARAAACLQRLQSRNPRRQLAGGREASGARDARLLARAVHERKERAPRPSRARRSLSATALRKDAHSLISCCMYTISSVAAAPTLAAGKRFASAARVRHIRRQERLAQPEWRQQRQPPERRRVVAGPVAHVTTSRTRCAHGARRDDQ